MADADAISRTKSLNRKFLPVGELLPNPENPNEMSEREFNLLYDNIERMGVTDPILVRPHPESAGKYKIVGGHNRWEVAKLLGLEEVPVTIIEDPEFDDDMERFQMVRHNIIHGKMSPKKFLTLFEKLQDKYSEEMAAEMFGFVGEEEFKKMINQTASSLPLEMQVSFKKAAKEVKTIDDLATLLNRMFTQYGESLKYGYMIIDYGGHKSVWLRMESHPYKHLLDLAEKCRLSGKSLDAVFAYAIREMAHGSGEDLFLAALQASPPLDKEIPAGKLPTLEELDA